MHNHESRQRISNVIDAIHRAWFATSEDDALTNIAATLEYLEQAQAHLDGALTEMVRHARDKGFTWNDIGACLGLHESTVAQKYRVPSDHGVRNKGL